MRLYRLSTFYNLPKLFANMSAGTAKVDPNPKEVPMQAFNGIRLCNILNSKRVSGAGPASKKVFSVHFNKIYIVFASFLVGTSVNLPVARRRQQTKHQGNENDGSPTGR